MTFLNKKSVIIAFILLASFLFLLAPKPSLAAVPTFETNPKVVGSEVTSALKNTITALSTAEGFAQQLLEWAFEMATEALRHQLLNMLVDQIVNWIQGGGSPKFITDWPGFFRDAVDQAGGRFLQQLGLGQLCSAFGRRLSAAFIPIPTFSQRSSCTISQVGANLEAFLKDFRQGGWIAWDEMMRPQNNIYGAYLMAWDQYEIEKSAAQKAAEAEAQAGRGFLSVRRCIAWNNEGYQMCVASGLLESECKKASCIKEEIVTPGAVVGDLAATAVSSDILYLTGGAKSFSAYVAAIANAILNRMFAEGIGLLNMAFSSGSSSTSGGAVTSAAQLQCSQLLGTAAYNECVAAVQSGIDMREFQKNYLISYINEDLSAQNQLLGAKQATLAVLNSSISILTELAACQGSAPQLSQATSNKSKIEQQIAAIQSDIVALQMKQQEIRAITNLSMVTAFYAQVIATVNPARTQTLVFSAQDETNQKYQDEASYQQQLTSCQQQQQLMETGR